MLETNHGVGVVEGSLAAGGDMPMDDGLWLMLREKIKKLEQGCREGIQSYDVLWREAGRLLTRRVLCSRVSDQLTEPIGPLSLRSVGRPPLGPVLFQSLS